MEINNLFKLLAINSSGDRQARPEPIIEDSYSKHEAMYNDISFSMGLSQKADLSPRQVVGLYLEQMNAAKQNLVSDHSAILGHLTTSFTQTFPEQAPTPLSEIVGVYGNPMLQDSLFATIEQPEADQIRQFISENATHISALRSQDTEMRNFPKNLTEWLNKQHISIDAETLAAIQEVSANQMSIQKEQSDLERYQHISSNYNFELSQTKQQSVELRQQLEASYSLIGVNDYSLQQLLDNRNNNQPIGMIATDKQHSATTILEEWDITNNEMLQSYQNAQKQADHFPDMAQWAKHHGYNHPWLHS